MPTPPSPPQGLDRETLHDSAEALFYSRGVQAVGMDRIREDSGLSLKRIYALFRTKDELVVAVLRRRDLAWRARLASFVDARPDPADRALAVFDWLEEWFRSPGFRGCAWVNIHGELGASSIDVLREVRAHKQAFREQIVRWAGPESADAIHLLAEGAIVTAGITGDPEVARAARRSAEILLACASSTPPTTKSRHSPVDR